MTIRRITATVMATVAAAATMAGGIALASTGAEAPARSTAVAALAALPALPGTADLLSLRSAPRPLHLRTGALSFTIGSAVATPDRTLVVTEIKGVRTAHLRTAHGRTIWSGRLDRQGVTLLDERNGSSYTAYLITVGPIYAAIGDNVLTTATSIESTSVMMRGLDVRISATTWTGVPTSVTPNLKVRSSDGPVDGLGSTADAEIVAS